MPQLPQFVFWYHNEKMINYNSLKKHRITVWTGTDSGPGDEDRVLSHLNIREASEVDSGNYTCEPSNSQSDSILVFVSEGNALFYTTYISVTRRPANR